MPTSLAVFIDERKEKHFLRRPWLLLLRFTLVRFARSSPQSIHPFPPPLTERVKQGTTSQSMPTPHLLQKQQRPLTLNIPRMRHRLNSRHKILRPLLADSRLEHGNQFRNLDTLGWNRGFDFFGRGDIHDGSGRDRRAAAGGADGGGGGGLRTWLLAGTRALATDVGGGGGFGVGA